MANDLGTIGILVDVRGMPIVKDLSKELNNVAAAEKQVSAATQKVMADLQRAKGIMDLVRKSTEDTSVAFRKLSIQELQQAGKQMQGFERALANTRRSMGQMGQATQQIGYQVGDFFVQVQSGTNALVAFGQQATQLVGILPAFYKQLGMSVGALIGISSGLGIAIPLLTAIGAAFMRSGNNAEESAKQIDTYKEAYEGLTESIRNLRLEQQMMESGLGERQQVATNELIKLQAQYNVLLIEQTELAEKYNDASLMGQTQEQRANAEAIAATQQKIAEMERIIRLEEETARLINESKAAEAIRGALATKNAEDLNRAMEKALDAGVKFSQTDLASIVALAAKNGWSLASAIQAAFAAAGGGTIVNADPSMGPGFEGGGRNGDQIVQATYKPTFMELYERDVKKATGSTKKLKDSLDEATKAAEQLQKQLEAPLVSAVGSISDAFGNFVARGLRDFKGFVKSILGSFQSMIAQMIAMAVKNRIMLSLGIGGLTPGMAAAGQVAGLGSAGGMLGSLGIGQGIAGLAGGTGFLGGAGNAIAGLAGGGAGFFGIGANAAAAGGGFMATLGAAVPVLGAVAAVFGLLRKKTKELDSGLRITVGNMDALVETFRTVQTTRFFGLSKKVKTTVEEASAEVSDPVIKAIQDIQTQVIKAAEMFGIAESEFEDFVYKFDVSLKGLTDEQKIQKINEELLKMGDAFASLTGHFTSMNELLAAAQQRYDLQTRLLELQGDTEALLARQRELELAAVHDLNLALLQQIHTLEDQKKAEEERLEIERRALLAAEEAARVAQEKAGVDIRLLELQGKASDALKIRREQELAALDETNRALLQQVFDLEDLAEAQRLANEAAQEASRIAQEKASVEIKLLELQGKAADALRIKREQELAAVDESNRALLRMTFALEDYNEAMSLATQALEEANRAYESALGDLRGVMEREISSARSAMEEAKSVFDTALSNRYETLQNNLSSTEQALADAQQALAEAQRRAFEEGIQNRIAAVNASFNSLIAGLEARLDVAQRKAAASREVFEALDSALRDRRLASDAATFASRRSALSYVSSGGTDIDKLTSALGILNEPSEQFFGTFQDYARDFALTTNAIKENRDLAEATMTADEKTVMLLEQQIEQSRASQEAQVEALEKMLVVQEDFLTVSQAMEQLLSAQENYDQAKEAHDELLLQYPQLQETFISVGDALANYLAAQATYEQVQAQHAELVAQFPMLNESVLTVAQAVTNLQSAIAAQAAATAAQTAAQTALANAIAAANQAATTEAVPGFAVGGMHIGGPRIVGENGPELEVTGPSRIYSNRDTAAMFRDPNLASAVDGLRKEVSGMRSEQLQIQVEVSKNVKRIYDIERKWDTDGLPPERV